MIRGMVVIVVMVLYLMCIGLPVFLIGLVHRSRRLINRISFGWAQSLLTAGGARIVVIGEEHIGSGDARFFVGNHQSAMDIPAMIVALRGNIRFMAKKSLFRIPVFGWLLARNEFAPIDRERDRRAAASVEAMLQRLRRNPISFVVFPEGTRSRDGNLQPFRRGAMKILQRAGLPVVPFAIEGSLAVHRPRTLRVLPGTIRITFLPPISAGDVSSLPQAELHERVQRAVSNVLSAPERNAEPSTTPMISTLIERV